MRKLIKTARRAMSWWAVKENQSEAKSLALVFMAYFAQKLPAGFVGTTLLATLTSRLVGQGLTPETAAAVLAGFTAAAAFGWYVKPVLALLVDRWGSRLQWSLAGGAGIAIVLFLFSFVPQVGGYEWLFIAALALNLAASFQDLAVDAAAIEILVEKRRGAGQAAMKAGWLLGVFVGGPIALGLTANGTLSWAGVCIGVAALAAVTGVLIPAIFAPPAMRKRGSGARIGEGWGMKAVQGLRGLLSPEGRSELLAGLQRLGICRAKCAEKVGSLRQTVANFWSHHGLFIAALILAVVAYPAQAGTFPAFKPLLAKLGYTQVGVAWLEGFELWAGLAGVLVGAIVRAKMERLWGVGLAIVLVAFTYALSGALAGAWDSGALFFALAVLRSFADGLWGVQLFALLMDVCEDRKRPATSFALLMAATNLAALWAKLVGGQLPGLIGFAGLYLAGGIVQLFCLLPLVIIARRQKGSEG